MAISNLNNTHLSPVQIKAVEQALTDLEKALQPLTINLTPEERKRYGRVNEQNKLFVNKVYDFRMQSPQLGRPDVNWTEFVNDYNSRKTLEGFLNRINDLRSRISDAKTLHDFDNYTSALEDYGYTSLMAESNTVGYQNKHSELRQFFTRRPSDEEDTNTNGGTQPSGPTS